MLKLCKSENSMPTNISKQISEIITKNEHFS